MADNVTYINSITDGDVSLFLEQLLLAPEGTEWTPARVNIAQPPAGFIHMGAVVDDSPQLTVQKEQFVLSTGIPMVAHYQATVRIVGEFQLTLHSNRNSRLITSLGGLPAYHFPAGSDTHGQVAAKVAIGPSPTSVTTSVDPSRLRIQVNSTMKSGPWLDGLKKGDILVADAADKVNTTLNEAFVENVADAATPAGAKIITLSGPHGFPLTPTSGQAVMRVDRSEVLLGTNHIPYYHILGVADGLNGSQIVHDLGRATPRGQFVETLVNGVNARIPVIFDLFGYTAGTPHSTRSQVVVGSRHYFSPTTPGL